MGHSLANAEPSFISLFGYENKIHPFAVGFIVIFTLPLFKLTYDHLSLQVVPRLKKSPSTLILSRLSIIVHSLSLEANLVIAKMVSSQNCKHRITLDKPEQWEWLNLLHQNNSPRSLSVRSHRSRSTNKASQNSLPRGTNASRT